MEIHISNLNPDERKDAIEHWLTPPLNSSGIYKFHLDKKKGKNWGCLTVADTSKAQSFLANVALWRDLPRHPHTYRPPYFKRSHKNADPVLLKVLRQEETEWNSRKDRPATLKSSTAKCGNSSNQPATIQITSIECGRWQAGIKSMEFVRYYQSTVTGKPAKRDRTLTLDLTLVPSQNRLEIKLDYTQIQSVVLSKTANKHYLVLSLSVAPKICGPQGVDTMMEFLAIKSILESFRSASPQDVRYDRLSKNDDLLTGICLVYRLELDFNSNTDQLQQQLAQLIPRHVDIYCRHRYIPRAPIRTLHQAVETLNSNLDHHKFSFTAKFQVQSLWANAILSPSEVLRLWPVLTSVQEQFGNEGVVNAIRSLCAQLYSTQPGLALTDSGLQKAQTILSAYTGNTFMADRLRRRNEISVHRVCVSPTGTYLYGPDYESSNRVTRQYSDHETCFIRVSFVDESGEKLSFDAEASNDEILRGRFQRTLQQGMTVAGRLFEFLGFSHSSLRSQTCWFMSSFMQEGSLKTAQAVIKSLGDFTSIRCPAKCAARIGQAFSDTQKAITINPEHVNTVKDIEREGHIFTDGCGTISEAMWLRLKNISAGRPSTLFQIRYKGAKGMLSLDPTLKGEQLCLRPSMIKFTGSPSNDLEICGTNSRPLAFKLNRPVVKILEDLGIGWYAFKKLQEQAVEKLRNSARSTRSAIDFLCANLSESATGIADLIRCLNGLGIDAAEDEFLRSVIRTLIEIQLRDIKFRTRIPVPHAVTLYGICDETEFLAQGQVCVTFETGEGKHTFLNRKVAVTRSPALHPGDVQVAQAVTPPPNSPLLRLTNCIVFSQKGSRDMPSMLGGGDLDGDLFNVIYDEELIPMEGDDPADYSPIQPLEIDRTVTSSDMAKFFVDFMESDQLGRIATMHQVYADSEPLGTRSEICLELAKLHSAAVDFSKSGRAVNWKDVPHTPACRPDFMAPSASTKIERNIRDLEDQVARESGNSQRYRYYQSDRILGKLYRSINEEEFFEDLCDENESIFGREGNDCVMDEVWRFVSEAVKDDHRWINHVETARDVKEHYDLVMLEIMSQYELGGTQTLTEKEVLIGTIVGKSGASNKYQREQSEMMKARYKREVQHLHECMRTQSNNDPDVYLSMAVACLSICTPKSGIPNSETRMSGADADLKSFAWFAAAICVPRLANWNK